MAGRAVMRRNRSLQPGEIYRSAGFPDVAVVGILEDGIPWEMPYRCPDIVWNPYRRKFSILVRILADGRTTDIPLGRFLRIFGGAICGAA